MRAIKDKHKQGHLLRSSGSAKREIRDLTWTGVQQQDPLAHAFPGVTETELCTVLVLLIRNESTQTILWIELIDFLHETSEAECFQFYEATKSLFFLEGASMSCGWIQAASRACWSSCNTPDFATWFLGCLRTRLQRHLLYTVYRYDRVWMKCNECVRRQFGILL
jgi:hypothetical protein